MLGAEDVLPVVDVLAAEGWGFEAQLSHGARV